MNLFSIILPTYNRAHLISRATQSILEQSCYDWELIIVDDGSTDNTREVIEQFNDPRIKYIYQKNQERSTARNRGIQEAKGKWICFLDSDDTYEPNRLESWKTLIENATPGLYYSELKLTNGQVHFPEKNQDETVQEFLLRAHLFCQQVIVHRSVFQNHQFDPELTIGEDTELWIRISKDYSVTPFETGVYSILNEHEDRSVNLKKNNAAIKELKSLEKIFAHTDLKQIGKDSRKKVLSETQFNAAKHYMLNDQKTEAKRWIQKSLITNWSHPQRKHRLFCLFSLLKGRIPEEYK